MPNNETPDESYFLEIFGVPSKFRFIVQVHKQAAAGRPSPIARLPQKLSLPDYWISVSFFLELSWVMHMAMNATTEMATMYQAGAMALPVASMRADAR